MSEQMTDCPSIKKNDEGFYNLTVGGDPLEP